MVEYRSQLKWLGSVPEGCQKKAVPQELQID